MRKCQIIIKWYTVLFLDHHLQKMFHRMRVQANLIGLQFPSNTRAIGFLMSRAIVACEICLYLFAAASIISAAMSLSLWSRCSANTSSGQWRSRINDCRASSFHNMSSDVAHPLLEKIRNNTYRVWKLNFSYCSG